MANFAVIVAIFGLFLVPSLAFDSRIVGGWDATPGQFPHQVYLVVSGYFCGGSIISPTFILTAVHCVVDSSNIPYTGSSITVVAGTNSLSSGGVAKTGKNVFVHASYGNFLYDIALIELSSAWTYTTLIQPIALATTAPPYGANITISGWGLTSHGGVQPTNLKYNILTADTRLSCTTVPSVTEEVLLCLAHSSGNGACNGDSGGPATYNGKIVGVANFVRGGCGSTYSDGYASVAYFYSWIMARI